SSSSSSSFSFTVLPKFDPFISGLQHTYRYGDLIMLNCSSEWSNPPATLTWYINNKTAPLTTIQPQINEITRSTDGFLLYASNLQLRIHIDDPRFIAKSEVFELKCVADIMAIASVRRESKITATILALQDTTSHKQRLMGQSSTSGGDSLLRLAFIAVFAELFTVCDLPVVALFLLGLISDASPSVQCLIYALIMSMSVSLWQTGCWS
uniref:Ig-like domain-containing protein n=1 Tax=Glossina austeni TaxID=7395 RepID=A0A1A9UTG5_GLOAU